ncbi:MAG: nitrogen regulation protein NR(II), partial [Nitrospinales bacterium]
ITQLKRLEEEVQRNHRLKAMGEMAAGIAHEIRNPLGGIELFASLLRKDLKDDPEKKQIAEHICAGVKNMDRIISSILLFAKSPEPSRQKCEINGLLNELLESPSSVAFPDDIKIVRQFSPGELFGNGDRALLKQVLLNVLRNAVQALPAGGELRLATQGSESSAAYGNRRSLVIITVSDTGGGIPPENLAKIFNPFFTTRERGTGLGLAIAHNIIKAHQGTIEVDSRAGQGTTFTIKIPAWKG